HFRNSSRPPDQINCIYPLAIPSDSISNFSKRLLAGCIFRNQRIFAKSSLRKDAAPGSETDQVRDGRGVSLFRGKESIINILRGYIWRGEKDRTTLIVSSKVRQK
ncbi:hypothetical protein DVH24_022599, partial [Malus domestica]